MAKPAVDISFTGDKELIRAFRKLGDEKVQKRFARGALKKGAEIIMHDWEFRIPVLTGALLSSVELVAGKRSKRRGSLGWFITTGSREQLGISPKDPFYYPAVQEYGGVREDGTVIPPNAAGRTALESQRIRAIDIIANDLWRRIRRIKAK